MKNCHFFIRVLLINDHQEKSRKIRNCTIKYQKYVESMRFRILKFHYIRISIRPSAIGGVSNWGYSNLGILTYRILRAKFFEIWKIEKPWTGSERL